MPHTYHEDCESTSLHYIIRIHALHHFKRMKTGNIFAMDGISIDAEQCALLIGDKMMQPCIGAKKYRMPTIQHFLMCSTLKEVQELKCVCKGGTPFMAQCSFPIPFFLHQVIKASKREAPTSNLLFKCIGITKYYMAQKS
jgi:hypothetical protein